MNNNLTYLLKNYLTDYVKQHNEHIVDLHKMCVTELERVLIETVMDYTQGNQLQSANILGLNRSTLKRKIVEYKMERLIKK